MKRFGVLGAVAFALLVAASPAAAREWTGDGAAGYTTTTFTTLRYGVFQLTMDANNETGTSRCQLAMTLDGIGWTTDAEPSATNVTSRIVRLRRGQHTLVVRSACSWQVALKR